MPTLRASPRLRRLRNDFRALQQLREESSILDFKADGTPPHSYLVQFFGSGLWRPDGTHEILIRDHHEVTIELGASYPRMPPALAWRTPIFHPNISASGVVCLGGYGTYWVPGVGLAELCVMLWDMVRYENFDPKSPYNRDAAGWVKAQCTYALPVDSRPLRDRVAGLSRGNGDTPPSWNACGVPDVRFLEAEVVTAEVIEPPTPDIVFID